MEPQLYRPAPGEIPTDPGVYKFLGDEGRVIYVGKAKNLRNRLSSYFTNPAALHPRTFTMVHAATSVEWTVVGNEVEALQLEWTWINEFNPRFNVMFRDDKSYPYLAITVKDEFPRVFVTRGTRRKGVKYYGPFTAVWAIRESLDLLLKAFPVRTCANTVFERAKKSGRPCLLGYIDKCSAPCVGNISAEDHRQLVRNVTEFMSGNSGKFITVRKKSMAEAAASLDFERAAQLRDEISALEAVLDKNAVVLSQSADADIFGLYAEELEACINVFHVRGGRIRGQHNWIIERMEDMTAEQLVEDAIRQAYTDVTADAIPTEILTSAVPADLNLLTAWLEGTRGAKIDIRVPQRGEKKAVLDTAELNAKQALALHKTRRASDITTRTQALNEIQGALKLPEAPLRIECIDNSHLSGQHVVGSLVVFEDGLPKKKDYKRFSIQGEAARDDTSAMYSVVSRRFERYLESLDKKNPGETSNGFGYRPSLLVVDGALPQVNAATKALGDLGVTDITVVGLAKRLEEVWVLWDEFPVILPRNSESLFLLQRVRDEAHRFAITYHRQKRSTSMTRSELDAIEGLGAAKQKALLAHFGSVKRIRVASVEELTGVSGIGVALAERIHEHFSLGTVEAPKEGQGS